MESWFPDYSLSVRKPNTFPFPPSPKKGDYNDTLYHSTETSSSVFSPNYPSYAHRTRSHTTPLRETPYLSLQYNLSESRLPPIPSTHRYAPHLLHLHHSAPTRPFFVVLEHLTWQIKQEETPKFVSYISEFKFKRLESKKIPFFSL